MGRAKATPARKARKYAVVPAQRDAGEGVAAVRAEYPDSYEEAKQQLLEAVWQAGLKGQAACAKVWLDYAEPTSTGELTPQERAWFKACGANLLKQLEEEEETRDWAESG